MENLFGVFVVVFVLVVIGILGYYIYNLAQPTVMSRVKVVSKRTSMTQHQGQMAQTHYHCTFEFEGGKRKEYNVSAKWYGLLAESDRGELDTKGVLFWDFRRIGDQ